MYSDCATLLAFIDFENSLFTVCLPCIELQQFPARYRLANLNEK
ncbi:hypothetical protein N473_08905 [Pseudoalteromonas luteoviolacea CPMOR-1]|uniref:Uncharacterized protein n=1 Tax=Pseudoalteromonas luteoviolacea CPMOR-1 TaxID=1365248 RepID=A0A167MJ99_9GAMM|nr:hypothetical protein N473_08905 [Pseudoalteromonas luteoviolacea CPMOR-1]